MLVPKRTLMIGAALVGVAVLYTSNMAPPGEGSTPTSGEGTCRMAVTADVLNVRAAPATTAEVVGKFRQGAETVADKVVQDGFRKLGPSRWAAAEFLTPIAGHDCG